MKRVGRRQTSWMGDKSRFGDGESLVRLVPALGARSGVGDLLAEGIKVAGDTLGIPDLVTSVKIGLIGLGKMGGGLARNLNLVMRTATQCSRS